MRYLQEQVIEFLWFFDVYFDWIFDKWQVLFLISQSFLEIYPKFIGSFLHVRREGRNYNKSSEQFLLSFWLEEERRAGNHIACSNYSFSWEPSGHTGYRTQVVSYSNVNLWQIAVSSISLLILLSLSLPPPLPFPLPRPSYNFYHGLFLLHSLNSKSNLRPVLSGVRKCINEN